MGLLPLVKGADGRWMPGIGDPSAMGWVTVIAYFVAALVCWRASRRAGGWDPYADTDPKLAWVFMGLAMLLAALGVNKQLDIQSLLTQFGEDLAREGGWYENRRVVQTLFVIGMGTVSVATGAVALWWLRDRLGQLWPAIAGTTLLLGFVVIRAASFHHVDWLLYRSTGPIKLNWVFELGGLAFIGFGALRPGALTSRSPTAPRAPSY